MNEQDGMIYNLGALRELEARYGSSPLHALASRALSELREREAVEDEGGQLHRISESPLLTPGETNMIRPNASARFWLERIHLVAFERGIHLVQVKLGTVLELETNQGPGWPLLPHNFHGVTYYAATLHVRRCILPDTLVSVEAYNGSASPVRVHLLAIGPAV